MNKFFFFGKNQYTTTTSPVKRKGPRSELKDSNAPETIQLAIISNNYWYQHDFENINIVHDQVSNEIII